jgi:hypothetical protein
MDIAEWRRQILGGMVAEHVTATVVDGDAGAGARGRDPAIPRDYAGLPEVDAVVVASGGPSSHQGWSVHHERGLKRPVMPRVVV